MKNSNSYQQDPPDGRISPTSTLTPHQTANDSADPTAASATPAISNTEPRPDGRPAMATREMSEKEIVQLNTELNAGTAQRRNSSNPRGSISRRQSGQSATADGHPHDESGARLKWDEANLYLNEGQMGGRMKIDEPKTPYAGHYDPTDDDAAVAEHTSPLDAQALNVDELDLKNGDGTSSNHQQRKPASRDSDIPGLDIGEPEMEPDAGADADADASDAEKKVLVDSDFMDIDGGRHGEEKVEDMTSEDREKHKRFEEMRKKHYEMKNVKNLLG